MTETVEKMIITKTIAKALVEAQKKARVVVKDGANQRENYAYASAESVIEVAREALGAVGLALVTLQWTFVERPTGDPLAAGVLRVGYALVHGETGELAIFGSEWLVVDEEGRAIDRAIAGALTANLAYFLRGLLLLPRVEDDGGRARAPRSNGELTIPGGDTKGTPLSRASTQDLTYWANRLKDELGGNTSRDVARDTVLFDGIRAELKKREDARARPPTTNHAPATPPAAKK